MHDLTLGDSTQGVILKDLAVTERLLARASGRASGGQGEAEIWALPDLGLPHNVRRIHGGFFTGALYQWTSRVPIAPIDATVNVCSVSLFRLREPLEGLTQFNRRIAEAIELTRDRSSYVWNFHSGNHFITYARALSGDIGEGHYLVLHSSASEFKRQVNGLYPTPGNWYMHGVKTVEDLETGRHLRYIDGHLAEDFYRLAALLVSTNRLRHQFFASIIAGPDNIADEVLTHPHYGMPSPASVAIGCQWFPEPTRFVLLTGPGQPLYLVQSRRADQNLVSLASGSVQVYPHGLGKQSDRPLTLVYEQDGLRINGNTYGLKDTLEGNESFSLRSLGGASPSGIPLNVSRLLAACPGDVVGELMPVFSYDRASSVEQQTGHISSR